MDSKTVTQKSRTNTLLIRVNQSEPYHKEEYVNISTSRVSDEQDKHGKWRKIRDKCMKGTQVSYFFSFSNACHVSCVWPTSLKLGCIPYDPGSSARPISIRKHKKSPHTFAHLVNFSNVVETSCYFDHRIKQTFHMFSLCDLRFVLCSRGLDVLRAQRIIGFILITHKSPRSNNWITWLLISTRSFLRWHILVWE